MDELEFRRRVYANPNELDQETLDAAQGNPGYQKILQQTRELELALSSLKGNAAAPAGLKEKLMAIPDAASSSDNVVAINSPKQNLFQYYAVAACLLLAVGVTFSLRANNQLSSADLAFGNDILAHLYQDAEEIDDINSGLLNDIIAIPAVNESMINTGTRLENSELVNTLAIRSAKPCEILPAYDSAHLLMDGTQGVVSVIVINNSPVRNEYSIRDDRFNGIVIPMGDGNLILIGEKNENLDHFKTLFSESVTGII